MVFPLSEKSNAFQTTTHLTYQLNQINNFRNKLLSICIYKIDLLSSYILNQQKWTFLDDFGRQHNVGIYHSPASGNLMIYCNAKIVLIDFLVKSPKDYSFFIEEELCIIKIEQAKGENFSYDFKVNKKVDTPLNKLRESREKKYLYYSLAIIFVFLLLIGLIIYYFA